MEKNFLDDLMFHGTGSFGKKIRADVETKREESEVDQITNEMNCTEKFIESLNEFLADHGKEGVVEPVDFELCSFERDFISEVISSEDSHWELDGMYSNTGNPAIFNFDTKYIEDNETSTLVIYGAEGELL